MLRTFASSLFLLLLWSSLYSVTALAQTPIGGWRDHFPYDHCISVTHSRNKVYAATENGVIAYSSIDNSIERINKINALSDIGISKIRYNRDLGLLVVGYKNGGVDILSNDATWAISDIKNSSILASKTIHDIRFRGERAYLSCGFGIVVLDLSKKIVQASYIIGNNSSPVEVHGTVIYKDSLFAATASGVYKASLSSPNLSDFQEWTKTEPSGIAGPFVDIVRFDNRLFLLHNPSDPSIRDSVLQYENSQWEGYEVNPRNPAITDLETSDEKLIIASDGYLLANDKADNLARIVYGQPWKGNPLPQEALFWKNKFWFADLRNGLVGMVNSTTGERIKPDGPETTNSFDMKVQEDKLWIATGSVNNSWNPHYQNHGVLRFHKDDWETFDGKDQSLLDTVYDPISVAIDPQDPSHVFVGTWGSGLLEMKNGVVQTVYGPSNSTLEENSNVAGLVATWGCSFDKKGNLWVTNSFNNEPVSVLTKEGNWHSLDLGGTFSSTGRYGSIMCSSFGLKWVILTNSNGLLVIDDRGTPANPNDDRHRILTNSPGSGNLPSNLVISLAEDKDQEIWVGTDKGIGVFYTPDDLFSQNPSDAQEILVNFDGFLEPLLDNEEVTSIKVDGADQKWIGTANSGVFHVSADGKEQLHRFSENKTPLIDDGIKDIAIHPKTGEVFFGTNSGIISFRGQATKGTQNLENVVIYPNPVRKDHTGPVAIRGLPSNSIVHITDVSGDLVFKGRAKGGQAIWDGTDTEGLRVRTGVYLVFVSSPTGKQSMAGKLMFFH
ncbi:MAG: two-component regulator propeller domain-containing protein [Flavobacteriales bacterium]